MPQFCILFYANYTIMATQRGAMAQCPPLNAPLHSPIAVGRKMQYNVFYCIFLLLKSLRNISKLLLYSYLYDLLNFGAKNFISYFIKCNIGTFFENFRSYSKRFNLNYTYLKARYIIQMGRVIAAQRCKRADYFRPEPGPNPKTNLKPKSCPKKNKS